MDIFNQCGEAFNQARTFDRARQLALGILHCNGRRTVTGMLSASGLQFRDWSAAYRLFSNNRMDMDRIFSVIRQHLVGHILDDQQPVYVHMDDTLLRKRGRKIPGTSYMRDPLGPPFQTNLIWGQRFVQLSVSLPSDSGVCQSRAIPVDMHHCPVAKKPGKKADAQQLQAYKAEQKEKNLSKVGSERLKLLRARLDEDGFAHRKVIVSVDGSYTNTTVLKNLPDNLTLIGRIRKDCALHMLPEEYQGVGRRRVYGDSLPTPEQIRQSDKYPWHKVQAWAAGKMHTFNVKIIEQVRWRKAGEKNLKLVIIRPLSYRLTKKSKLLYRKPAYLICTDPELDIQQLLQAYLWRWEIEVNIRDEKTLLGCGQAQVRNEQSVELLPAFVTAIYAMLLLAGHRHGDPDKNLPRPKWYQRKPEKRCTTGDMINAFRSQFWARNMGINFSDFVNLQNVNRSRRNVVEPLLSAALYLRN